MDKNTLEVVGPVVATDGFGDAYVISLVDILADVQDRLGAKLVELASASVIRSVGTVLESLDMLRAPQLDAIRGNSMPARGGYDYTNHLSPLLSGVRSEADGSDSGYGSYGGNPLNAGSASLCRDNYSACLPLPTVDRGEIDPMYQLFVDAVIPVTDSDEAKLDVPRSLEHSARRFSVSRAQSETYSNKRMPNYGSLIGLLVYVIPTEREIGNRKAISHLCLLRWGHLSWQVYNFTCPSLLGLLGSENWTDTAAFMELVTQVRDGRRQMPVPRSASVNGAGTPTTSGVHLYRDDGLSLPHPPPHRRTATLGPRSGPQLPVYPLFLTDCEGFNVGVAKTSALEMRD